MTDEKNTLPTAASNEEDQLFATGTVNLELGDELVRRKDVEKLIEGAKEEIDRSGAQINYSLASRIINKLLEEARQE